MLECKPQALSLKRLGDRAREQQTNFCPRGTQILVGDTDKNRRVNAMEK